MENHDLPGQHHGDPPGSSQAGLPRPPGPLSSSSLEIEHENSISLGENCGSISTFGATGVLLMDSKNDHPENMPLSRFNGIEVHENHEMLIGTHEDLVELTGNDDEDRLLTERYGDTKDKSNNRHGSKNRTENSIYGKNNLEKVKNRIHSINSEKPEHDENDESIAHTRKAVLQSPGSENSKNRPDSVIRKNSENVQIDEKNMSYEENINPSRLIPSFQADKYVSSNQFHDLGEQKSREASKRSFSYNTEEDLFEEQFSSRRRSVDTVISIGEIAPKKAPNPRILILDFVDKNVLPVTHVQLVRNIIITNTQIRSFSTKILERGGISLLFNSPKAKQFAEKVINDKISNQLKKKGFLQTKKSFEVICSLPKDLNADNLSRALKAIKIVKLGHGKFVFSVTSKEQAVLLISDGYLYGAYHIEFKPYTFKPKIACFKCGSIYHSTCSLELFPKEIQKETLASNNCVNCRKPGHSAKECPLYLEKLKKATENKKSSYAAALGSKASPPTVTNSLQGYRVRDMAAPGSKASPPTVTNSGLSQILNTQIIADVVSAVLKHLKVDVSAQDINKVITETIKNLSSPPVQPPPESASQPFVPIINKPKTIMKRNAPRKPAPSKNTASRKSVLSKYSEEALALAASKQTNQSLEKSNQNMEIVQSGNQPENSDVEIESASPEPSDSETQTSSGGRGGKPRYVSKVQRELQEFEKQQEKAASLPLDISHVVYPYCSCGEKYQMSPSWEKHFCEGKDEMFDGIEHFVKCLCKKQVTLTKENYSTNVALFHEHLIHECINAPKNRSKHTRKNKQKSLPDQSHFPKCGCGHVYKAVASWKKHWEKVKDPCTSQKVTCQCGDMELTSENYDTSVNVFNEHSARCSQDSLSNSSKQ
jgi:hypothetical protein